MINFFAKRLNKKGFTLAELLIVVAIIAVLVAIAMPIFMGALDKARLGVHRSNARSLKSLGVAAILADPDFEKNDKAKSWTVLGYYDFTKETFTIKSIKYSEDENVSPKMSVAKETTASTAPTSGWYAIGVNDDEIGRIGTSGVVWYSVDVVENEIASISVTKKS